MIERHDPAREASGALCPPGPPRRFSEVAGAFIVHGHRLASLYRDPIEHPNPFIVPKIRKKLRSMPGGGFAYFWNNEARGRAR
jgi:hypothetical protein